MRSIAVRQSLALELTPVKEDMTDVHPSSHDAKSERHPVLILVCACAGLIAFPALLQLVLHPILSGGSLQTWGLYWLYTLLGVVLPGTMIAVSTIRWRADWLTWVGIGWTLGHAFELVSFLISKQTGQTELFLLWIPAAFAACWTRRQEWHTKLERLVAPARTYGALIFLFALTGLTFFAISLPEISTAPPYISDVWFHVNNAHEFRDHSPMQNPRLAGESFNYHVFGYAASAAASLAVSEPLAPILTRYSGMSCAALLALNLFTLGRALGRRSIAAGVLSALLVVFPVEIGTLFSSKLNFGATFPLYGVYLSTSTLAGFVFLAPLLLLIRWFYQGMRIRDGWVLTLLAFAGAGSKTMLGPVIICGAAGVVAWKLLRARQFDRRSFNLVLFMAAGILPPMLPLIFGDGSFSETIRWNFASFSQHTLGYHELVRWGIPEPVASFGWLLGFDALFLVGAAIASYFMGSEPGDSTFVTFVWMSLIAALVPSLGIELHGAAQLFFLYFANAILASIAGFGFVVLARSRYARRVLAFLSIIWVVVQGFTGFGGSLKIIGATQNSIWTRVDWWSDAVTDRDSPVPNPIPFAMRPSLFRKKLYLTPEIREGLEWARNHVPPDGVFVVNARDASPYSAYCECRAFYETSYFHVSSHMAEPGTTPRHFAPRQRILAQWGKLLPGIVERMSALGITHVFVDHVNGFRWIGPATLEPPVFANAAFEIYELPPGPPLLSRLTGPSS